MPPIERDVGNQEIDDVQASIDDAVLVGRGHSGETPERANDSSSDKAEGEDVGTDHPLFVFRNLAVASGEEGHERSDEPDTSVGSDTDGIERIFGPDDGDENAHGRGDQDRAYIPAAEYAMKLRVLAADSRRELNRTR